MKNQGNSNIVDHHIGYQTGEVEGAELSAGACTKKACEVLEPECLLLVSRLERKFRVWREQLLQARDKRQLAYDKGENPGYLSRESEAVKGKWKVAKLPGDLLRRRVEITGPVNDPKMVINMLSRTNEGARADTAMLDFEDSMMPLWENVVDGFLNVIGAAKGDLSFIAQNGKTYQLNPDDMAHPMIRVRGLHMLESNVLVDGKPVCAGLFDLAVCFYHTARILMESGKTPTYYIPKCQHRLEARWWNELFRELQNEMELPSGSLRATFLIETLEAAFQCEEILYEIREHAAGLNTGRWDKIFSDIKCLRARPEQITSDRAAIDMKKSWMDNYAKKVVKVCHKRGALAIGGMSAFTPGKTEEERARQTKKVVEDKAYEASIGHDGCWVSHPYFIEPAMGRFKQDNQINIMAKGFPDTPDLLPRMEGKRTMEGLRANVRVGIAYTRARAKGLGCVAWDGLMEDLATMEISRAQTWQWIRHKARLDDGQTVNAQLVEKVFDEELERIVQETERGPQDAFFKYKLEEEFRQASERAKEIFLEKELADFLEPNSPLAGGEGGESAKDLEAAFKFKEVLENQNAPMEGALNPARVMEQDWSKNPRWKGIKRRHKASQVIKLRGSYHIEHSLARMGARRLWELLKDEDYIASLGALTGNQAAQQVKAGLKAIYLSGWQVAADANLACNMYPDQSLYPANSVPAVVKRINNALLRADQIEVSETGMASRRWLAPIVADAEAGFGGALNAFELMKSMIEAGAAGVHFEDQLAGEKKCGHLGGKVLVPTCQFIKTLSSARLAADIMDTPTILIARTDAEAAKLLTSDVDEADHPFLTGERTPEGFYKIRNGMESCIARGRAYAPYADLVWCETSTPDLRQAKTFAEGIRKEFPDKMLAYNCSPSFNWGKKLDHTSIAIFQRELAAMGYKFQFVTLAGFHALNHSMFELARAYKQRGMSAYSELQQKEFASEANGYTATKHQREVGTGYFDLVNQACSEGESSTLAVKGSTEEEQFVSLSGR